MGTNRTINGARKGYIALGPVPALDGPGHTHTHTHTRLNETMPTPTPPFTYYYPHSSLTYYYPHPSPCYPLTLPTTTPTPPLTYHYPLLLPLPTTTPTPPLTYVMDWGLIVLFFVRGPCGSYCYGGLTYGSAGPFCVCVYMCMHSDVG